MTSQDPRRFYRCWVSVFRYNYWQIGYYNLMQCPSIWSRCLWISSPIDALVNMSHRRNGVYEGNQEILIWRFAFKVTHIRQKQYSNVFFLSISTENKINTTTRRRNGFLTNDTLVCSTCDAQRYMLAQLWKTCLERHPDLHAQTTSKTISTAQSIIHNVLLPLQSF